MKKLKNILLVFILVLGLSCNENKKGEQEPMLLWEAYNDSAEVAANAEHEVSRMRYKLIQSKVLDKNEVFRPLYTQVSQFTEAEYNELKPLVLEQNIPSIQEHVRNKKLNYEKLVLFYLYRIFKYELNNETTLNTVIALNKDVVDEARKLDEQFNADPSAERHPIYGMPILLKDNINTKGMRTTAGAIAMQENTVEDAFIVRQLKSKKALILGKVNLSEWAYYLCSGCPVGYSAVGGQTLNPYGRRIFETGGSSSGSGTSVAANYAVAAIGTETAGSILSPSSQNSVVGLKPTIGALSRSGIVPISSTLDTPGPMTKNTVDNRIVMSALVGKDNQDPKSVGNTPNFLNTLQDDTNLAGKRFGVFKGLMEGDSIYKATVEKMKAAGAIIVPFSPPQVNLDGFLSILNIDMKNDLPAYIDAYASKEKVKISSIADVVEFNAADSLVRIPYGQALFEGILADTTTAKELVGIKSTLQSNGRKYFDDALDTHQLDAILSINNYHAAFAAVAEYPALTIPMGYKISGEPISLTFIGKAFQEETLYSLGHAFEQVHTARKIPSQYQ